MADLYRYLMPDAALSGKARIPVGTFIGIDMYWTHWPCLVEGDVDPDIEFDVERRGDTVTLRAPGYGQKDAYGNGAIRIALSDWYRAHQPEGYKGAEP